jgi:hypothetical protein
MYAHITNNTIDTIGRLPKAADANGQWLTLTADNAHLAGWFEVVDAARPADTDTTTHDRSVELVDGTPTVVWTPRAWTTDEQTARTAKANGTTIRTQAEQAMVGNKTFLALASPTQAQTLAQVKALTKQNQGLIRLVLGKLDAVD